MSDPIAYFLSWHTYGTWLPGHSSGSVDNDHRAFGTLFAPASQERVVMCAREMTHPAVNLNQAQRKLVQAAILKVCDYRVWDLHALHVRATHVHAVVTANCKPEKVLNDFKAYATRRLRKENLASLDERIWSKHGSTRYVWKEEQLSEVIDYVVCRQGADLEPLPFVRINKNNQSPER